MACMPSFAEIMEFSESLGSLIGMDVINRREDSRVVLLGHPGEETDVRKIRGWRNGLP